MTREQFAWVVRLMFPISSRNRLPPSATSNRPGLVTTAPVKAPFMWPKSSLSRRFSDRTAQSTGTKGRSLRRLLKWIARAISSVPVPLSPVMRTVLTVGATLPTRR
jgi:hypothetical protein